MFGIAGINFWEWAIWSAFIILQIHGVTYSLYLHRASSHHSIELHPAIQHICRFLLWLTTLQMIDPKWLSKTVTRHRKHHIFVDSEGDPHSPHIFTFKQLVDWKHSGHPGHAQYVSNEDIEKYSADIINPSSWIDVNVYHRWPKLGNRITVVLMLLLFGIAGIIPAIMITYSSIIGVYLSQYLTHSFPGYTLKDHNPNCYAVNMWPWAILQTGEELHANHHADPTNPKLSIRWWEIDIGWLLIKVLATVKLVKIKQ